MSIRNLIVQLRSNFFPPGKKIFVSEHKSSNFNKHIFFKYTNSIFLISRIFFNLPGYLILSVLISCFLFFVFKYLKVILYSLITLLLEILGKLLLLCCICWFWRWTTFYIFSFGVMHLFLVGFSLWESLDESVSLQNFYFWFL